MKNKKEREVDTPIGTWTLIFACLGVFALMSAAITAIVTVLGLR